MEIDISAKVTIGSEQPLIIIKLGGSCLTNKTCFETLRPDVLSAIALHLRVVRITLLCSLHKIAPARNRKATLGFDSSSLFSR